MKHLLALTIPGYGKIDAPSGVPTGGAGTLGTIISVIFGVLIGAGVIISLIFVVWGGFSWIISGGDKQKLDRARKTLIWAIVGLIVMMVSFAFLKFLNDILGANFVSSPGTPAPPTGAPPGFMQGP